MSEVIPSKEALAMLVEKLRDINQLSTHLTAKERLEFFKAAKKHFYNAQCLLEKMIKEFDDGRKH